MDTINEGQYSFNEPYDKITVSVQFNIIFQL